MRHQGRPTAQTVVPPPTTRAELQVLSQRRNELRDQLQSLSDRHSQLLGERHNASASQNQAVVSELDARIREYSDRITRIEREKLLTDDAISAGIANGLGADEAFAGTPQVITLQPPNVTVDVPGEYGVQLGARELVMGGVSLAILGVFAWRWAWRRAERFRARALPAESQQTKDLRVAVETIALEVERISEGQRFITKLLAERAEKDQALLERAKPNPSNSVD